MAGVRLLIAVAIALHLSALPARAQGPALPPVPDPQRPQILIYEPVGDNLQLVAAEWFIPLATGIKERPSIFGQPFDGPMGGHHPLLPTDLHH